MSYRGTIIEESLQDKAILKEISILRTRVAKVTERDKTPWLEKWTLHTVEIPEEKAGEVAEELGQALESEHSWYADFKNATHHYIIFRNKIFYIDRHNEEEYQQAREYGISLGIPKYQVDFSPDID